MTQTILADRPDGHSAAGLPGNCLQAAVASLLDLELEEVPHFAVYLDWFAHMRRWARERGGDFTYYPFEDFAEHPEWAESWSRVQDWGGFVILGGSSPRGPFGHVVIGTPAPKVVHDPHPSRAGLIEIEDAIVYMDPYDPPPITKELAWPTRA